MEEIINKLSVNVGISSEEVKNAYRAYWKFIRATIEKLPLKEDLDNESFHKLRTNFNLPKLGKLYCDYSRYKTIKLINERLKNAKHKKGKIVG